MVTGAIAGAVIGGILSVLLVVAVILIIMTLRSVSACHNIIYILYCIWFVVQIKAEGKAVHRRKLT